MPRPRRIAVTGAAGFIGLGVCERLRSEGSEVVGLDVVDASGLLRPIGAEAAVASTADTEALDSVLAGCDGVVHTAAIVSDHGSMEQFIEVNVRGTRNVLDAARRHSVDSVVHVSSVASWGYEFSREPKDGDWTRRQGVPYIDTKAASDDLALRRGAAVVRPADVYGPRSQPWSVRPLEALSSGRFVLPGKGEGLMTPVYVDDLVDLVVRALDTPAAAGRAFTGFDGEAVTAATFFGHYAGMLGMDSVPTAPRPNAVAGVMAMEAVARLTGRPPTVSRTAMLFISRSASYDTSLAREVLGWESKVGLDEGMARTGEWFRSVGLLPGDGGS